MRYVADILWVSGVFVASAFALDALGVDRAGPYVILITLAVATWRLRGAGENWAAVGLHSPASWKRAVLWIVAAYVAVILVNMLVIIPLARRFAWPPTDFAKLGDLAGNLPLLAVWLFVAWTTAAFGEELLFRGFLQPRLTALLGGRPLAAIVAIASQATLFGLAHLTFGVRGAVTAAAIGVVFGAIYAVNGRNLWPLILAHGVTDTISLVALYFGAGTFLK